MSISIKAIAGTTTEFAAYWTDGATRGGMGYLIDPASNSVSINMITRGSLPRGSAGPNAAATLIQQGIVPQPTIIEITQISQELSTLIALRAGSTGQGTLLGNTLQNMVDTLGGRITSWAGEVDSIGHGTIRVTVEY